MKNIFFSIAIFVASASAAQAQKNPVFTESKRAVSGIRPADGQSTDMQAASTIDEIKHRFVPSPATSDSKLKIIFTPRAVYPTSETGTICMQGSVWLRVEFLADGTIGTIATISTLPYGATENAIAAAKKIIFQPAVKDGLPISSVRPVTFSFTIY